MTAMAPVLLTSPITHYTSPVDLDIARQPIVEIGTTA